MIRFATKEDGEAIAPLILVILKDMELPLLEIIPEKTLLAVLAEAVADPTYRYGYQRGLVYEDNGHVAGIAFGYPNEDEPIIDEPLKKVLRKYNLDEEIRIFIDPETLPGEWYLDSISVDEKYRGTGIGSKLLDALPKMAKRDGKEIIGLSVDKGNPNAKKLYSRKGFKDVAEMMISGHLYDHMQKKISE
ncbi:GNAT family N-acetyltransferase [Enterococcus ureilyticus]|uniref:GNAT family N-acetyltransferase n=1 Tax=Enterococcus ureilyticus TaxID=1131292 RepID=A0A1E5HEF1_9ENTE|nr:GNAT family N-acetyltransferase [Enterococcus ureilyticus]MBM7689562.1 ribosomal protein S18 acetylase RimI-like enzyme [Enterococcus ureilyticus]MBO0446228.1 GNAT family N-acetyltransferase [Enterococcus ureilyticus]OEG23313.1 GNAT family N-acetyltransferase [Enterococcus ureilyticus]